MAGQAITEEMKLHEQWFAEAKDVTLDTLVDFMRRVVDGYVHDYGTVVHAISACALAAAYAADKMPGARGGITGFQAGFVMWNFVRNWLGRKSPMRLIDYADMLYPQYRHKFVEQTVDPATWKFLQDEAGRLLFAERNNLAHPDVVAHWKSIAAGHVPFGYVVREDR